MTTDRPPLWLALHFPRLGLELARTFHEPAATGSEAIGWQADSAAAIHPVGAEPAVSAAPANPALPCVLIETRQQRRVIVAIDATAAAAGLRIGQTQAQAQALVGQLQCIPRDPAAERQALEHLAACAYRYSPEVRLDPAVGLLLEISRSLRLYESPCRSQPAGEPPIASHPKAKRRQVAALQKGPHTPPSGVRWPDRAFAPPDPSVPRSSRGLPLSPPIESSAEPQPTAGESQSAGEAPGPTALSRLLSRLHRDLQQLGFQADAGLGRTPAAARLRAQLVGARLMPSAFAHFSPPQQEPSLPDPIRRRRRDAQQHARPSESTMPPPPMPSLQPTPIEALPLPSRIRLALSGSGIANLAALRKLPRASLQRRYGAELPDLLDRLEGRKPEPGQPWHPPEHYQAEFELPAPTTLGEALRFPLRRLIHDLCLALTARDVAAEHLQLRFELERDRSEQMAAAVKHKPAPRKVPVGSRESGVGSTPQTTQPHATNSHPDHRSRRSLLADEASRRSHLAGEALRRSQPAGESFTHQPTTQRHGTRAALALLAPQPPDQVEGRLSALSPAALDLRLLQPSRDPRQLLQLIEQRLEHSTLPGRILSLRLTVPNLPAHRALQHDLFDPHAQGQHDWPRLLERLRARLGDRCLLQPQALPDHRPEHAAVLRTLAAPNHARHQQTPQHKQPSSFMQTLCSLRHDLLQAPLWLLPHPIPTEVESLRPLALPVRVESGWWASLDIRRDYYCATDSKGSACWIYHDFRAPHHKHLHGWFG